MPRKKYEPENFLRLCKEYDLPEPIPEFRFHPDRRWKFDWRFPGQILVDIQGGTFAGGKHARGKGLMKDYEKINTAQLMGYIALQFTPRQCIEGVFAQVVRDALDYRIVNAVGMHDTGVIGLPNHVKRAMALAAE